MDVLFVCLLFWIICVYLFCLMKGRGETVLYEAARWKGTETRE